MTENDFQEMAVEWFDYDVNFIGPNWLGQLIYFEVGFANNDGWLAGANYAPMSNECSKAITALGKILPPYMPIPYVYAMPDGGMEVGWTMLQDLYDNYCRLYLTFPGNGNATWETWLSSLVDADGVDHNDGKEYPIYAPENEDGLDCQFVEYMGYIIKDVTDMWLMERHCGFVSEEE